MSEQLGVEFKNDDVRVMDYSKLKKVYSIWICNNPVVKDRGSIIRYKLNQNVEFGYPRLKQYYDLIEVIVVNLDTPDKRHNLLIDFLSIIFLSIEPASVKIERLKKIGFEMSEEVIVMSKMYEETDEEFYERRIRMAYGTPEEITKRAQLKDLVGYISDF